ncbi:MAG: homocysteine S-methyltransferase family protein [Treponema sp.]|nr:homocysteine S-methyltransferase family protein [Treponema sp.]
MNRLKSLLGKQFLFLDGGTGSVLQSWGLQPGEFAENWNLTHPEKIQELHYNYFKAGSNIVVTDSFGLYETKFKNPAAIICAAVKNANAAKKRISKETGSKDYFVAYDVGPCGKLLKPSGDLDFEDAVSIFKKTLLIACDQPIDAIAIETMNDAYETKAAVIAAKEAREECGKKDLPIFVTNVYDKSSRLLTGAGPEAMVALLEGLGVDALGLNCGLGPEDLQDAALRLIKAASVPVIIKPNAGLPRDEGGKTVYDVSPKEFAKQMKPFAKEGALIFGGCCGTTPDFIRELSKAVKSCKPVPLTQKNTTVISSYTKAVYLGGENKPALIGERINPTGKKKFKEALRANDIPYIIHQGLEQEKAGCDILDVNVGLPEIDEEKMMVTVMTELQSVTDMPLQIDTSSPQVMEKALRLYNGKALVNSVNGKQEIMDAVFPIVKKYGGVVVALTLDEDGIPETAAGRLKIVKKIYANAKKYGIERKDILIDALTMSVSSDNNAALATLDTVKTVHDEYNGGTILGVSNISFGLPNRPDVTANFFSLAMHNGLSAAIINPLSVEIQKAYYSYCLLSGKDKDCLNYIEFTQRLPAPAAAPVTSSVQPSGQPVNSTESQNNENSNLAEGTLGYAVVHGLKNDSAEITRSLLEKTDSVHIINDMLIPGLDFVGQKFEQKKMFLPQLLMAAESAKASFEVIKEYLERTGKKGKSRGTIVMATVKNDIHDIGKNIVKVLLENYDFTVMDLGKDVDPEVIVEACIKNNIKLVGLSALMTTTVPSMQKTIELLREKSPQTKVCVGGAVLTKEYADMIGADRYSKDAIDTVHYAQEIFG